MFQGNSSLFLQTCEQLALDHFQIESLRIEQKEVLNLLHKSKRVLATLPTGAGKTLLYALPALAFAQMSPKLGPVCVVSPLISLMRDQIRRMSAAHVGAVLFTAEQSAEERTEAWEKLKSGQVHLIFVSPERFTLPKFLQSLQALNLAMMVVDEAHCMVSWGHSFRPEYSEVGRCIEQLNPPYVLALTATASRSYRAQIRRALQQNMVEYVSRPLGPHIFVKSIRCFSEQEKWLHLCEILQESTQNKTLVYFQSRRDCEWAAQGLQKKGFHAFIYHAGLEKQQRRDVESYIQATQKPKTIVCATTAFGMGVNVLNLSQVIVYGYPSNIEDFFQMLGRAGRSGEAALGVLLWSGSDDFKRKKQLDDLFPPVERLAKFWPYFSEFLPKRLYESRLFGVDTFALGGANEIPLKRLELKQEAILACLRFCGLLQDLKSYTTYVSIQFAPHMSLDELLAQLPETPTKRSQAWQALCQLFPTKNEAQQWKEYRGAEGVFSLERWSREAKMEEQGIEKILRYFEEKKELSFQFFEAKPAKQNFIVKNNIEFLLKSLPLYQDLRKEFIRSLHELQRLSTAKSCRLKESFSFFVDDTTPTEDLEPCGQCDLCFNKKGNVHYEKSRAHQKQELTDVFECYPETYERAGKAIPHQV